MDHQPLVLSQFNSIQSFLIQLIEQPPSLEYASAVLQQPPFNESLCAIPESSWLQACIKFGQIELLEKWLQRGDDSKGVKLDRLILKLHSYNVNKRDKHLYKHHIEMVVEWLMNQLDPSHASYHHRKLFVEDFVIENGFNRMLNPSTANERILFKNRLTSAVKSPQHVLFKTYFLEPILLLGSTATIQWALKSLLGLCQTCTRQDVVRILTRAIPSMTQAEALNHILKLACTEGNMHMVSLVVHEFHFSLNLVHFIRAVKSGDLDLIHFMRQQVPALEISYELLWQINFIFSQYSLNAYEEFIRQSPLTTSQAQFFVNVYMERSCGNREDMEILDILAAVQGVVFTPKHLSNVIDLESASYKLHCHRLDILNLVEFLVAQRVQPTQDHFYAALQRGRLDMIVFIHNNLSNQLFEFDFIKALRHVFHSRVLYPGPSLQEPSVIDYIFTLAEKQTTSRRKRKQHILSFLFGLQRSSISTRFKCYLPVFRKHLFELGLSYQEMAGL